MCKREYAAYRDDKPLPLFQNVTPDQPFGRDDVHPFSLSFRNVEDLLHEWGIDISCETVRVWWNRFRSMFAREMRKRRIQNQNYSRG